jgi:primary-amine oxidase
MMSSGFYTDNSGTSRKVLYQGSISEVHVPYHTGTPRFFDLTLSTSGLGANAITLDAAECPGGVLIAPTVCRQVDERGFAWKFGGLFQAGQAIKYWMASQLGQYTYIPIWTFRDDGTIEPAIGFTGRLDVIRSGSQYAAFGSRLDNTANGTPQYGLNHMHNVYWRLDLDINGSAGDAVNRRTQAIFAGTSPDGVNCSSSGSFGGTGGCRTNSETRLTTESVERLAPFQTWTEVDTTTLNADGRTIGYEIIPMGGGNIFTGPPSEPYEGGELFVTAYSSCESFAVNNNNTAVNPGCGTAAPNVRAMVNGQNVNGADIVLWYNAHFEHVTRDEDQLNMPIEYLSVEVQPRNWRDVNTLQ